MLPVSNNLLKIECSKHLDIDAVGFVFSGINKDLVIEFAKYLGSQDIVTLSGVSKNTYQALNNAYFKRHFENLYPVYAEGGTSYDPRYFQELTEYHPSNSWKVACCFFSKVGEVNFSNCFLEEVAPVFLKGFEADKKEAEQRLKKLSGSYYKDPRGLLDEKWRAYEKAPYHLKEMLLGEYNQLENERQSCVVRIADLDKRISLCSSENMRRWESPVSLHIDRVRGGLSSARNSFDRAESLCLFPDRLNECIILIDGILKGGEELEVLFVKYATPIHNLIDSFPQKIRNQIWGDLYFTCGVNDPASHHPQWSQIFFPEYLPELLNILLTYKN